MFFKIEPISLGAKPSLLTQLRELASDYPIIDLEALSHLPKGTLGYEYARYMLENKIQPLEISPKLQAIAEQKPFAFRFTITHDLFHVLLGFDTSHAGEIGVFAFTVAQNYSICMSAFHPLVRFIYPFALLKQKKAIWENSRRGYTLGKQADCLLLYQFEKDWTCSIDKIRDKLGLVLPEECKEG
ncbi:Coq4 family protein [Baaleninema simplex]|uniref:Coq4 family protein n=1 Tax=Baaleninema simplex TaxID=2862350 RepID=UPI000347CE8B|nr:Coq4 family protein [Baaleninema simplex]